MSKYVILEKIKEADNPKHPNNKEVGYINKGYFIKFPEVGKNFEVQAMSLRPGERGLSTSIVQEIIDNQTFRTYNSIYKFKIVNNINE